MKVHGVDADQVSEATYLGDIISQDGKNTKNVRSRVSKGMGIVTKIMDILNTVTFGKKYFEIAIILREAKLVNGMLTNIEVWHGLLNSEISELEEVDKLLLRKILQVPNSACIESLYLELGITPFKAVIKARRINHLHALVKLKDEEMLHTFFTAQWMYPGKNDWLDQVKEDLVDFEIDMTLEEIKSKSKNVFKKLVKQKMKEYALKYLNMLKDKHTKMDNLLYVKLKTQNYLKDGRIPVHAAKNLFKWRTRAAFFKMNYSNSYQDTSCPHCLVEPDSQEHSLECSEIKKLINVEGDYFDIFSNDIPRALAHALHKITKMREESMDK